MNTENGGFTARGGWWVLAQVPVMLGALVAPLVWGAGSFDGANAIQLAGAALTALGLLLAIAGLVALGSALTPFPGRSPMRACGNRAFTHGCAIRSMAPSFSRVWAGPWHG